MTRFVVENRPVGRAAWHGVGGSLGAGRREAVVESRPRYRFRDGSEDGEEWRSHVKRGWSTGGIWTPRGQKSSRTHPCFWLRQQDRWFYHEAKEKRNCRSRNEDKGLSF